MSDQYTLYIQHNRPMVERNVSMNVSIADLAVGG